VLDGYPARAPKMPDVARRFTASEVLSKPATADAPSSLQTGTPADDEQALVEATKRGDWETVERLARRLSVSRESSTLVAGEEESTPPMLDVSEPIIQN